MIKYFFLFLLFLMTTVTLPGQSDTYMFYHQIYTTDDGLSSRFIQDIYQDSRNFIWVSSNFGVNRFDGQRFKIYNQGKYKLQSDDIHEVREDQAGNLWFINRILGFKNEVKSWNRTMVDVLDYDKDEIISIEEYIGENLPFKWKNVIYIDQDESYTLWITTNEGKVYSYTDHFTEFPFGDRLMKGGVVYALPNAEFMLVGLGKIIKLNVNGELIYESDFKDKVYQVVPGENGKVFLVTAMDRALYEIDNKGQITLFVGEGEESDQSEQKININRFGTDPKGRVWVEGPNAIISLYDKGKRIFNVEMDRFSLSKSINNRFEFFADNSGGIWYCDLNGLNYMSLNKPGLTSYFSDESLSFREAFELTDSTLFINTYGGYYVLNKNTGYYEIFEGLRNVGYSQGGILLNGFIYNSLYRDEVAKINIQEQTVDYVAMNSPMTYAKTFILASDSTTILVGATNGLYMLDTKADVISVFEKYNEFEDLAKAEINDFVEIKGLVYIQTNNGLYILDWEKGILAHHDFAFNHLLHMYADQDGVFWIATRGGGLLEWHPKENRVNQYTMDEGLSHNIVYGIYGDTLNQLWLPSGKGLMRFNKKDKTIVTFLKGNGLKDDEFNQYAHHQDSNGKIYMGGVNGLIGFKPEDLSRYQEISSKSEIVVTEIAVSRTDNKTYNLSTNSLNNGEILVIEGNVLSTSITLSLLEYDRLASSQYYYKIEGIHDLWQPIKDQSILLTGLPGGVYDISIKVDAGIKLKSHYSKIKVQILKRFIHTWYFFSLCALGFLALGVSLSRYRIYRLGQIRLNLERKVRRRTKKIEDDKILISQQYREMERINKTKDHLITIIGHDLKDYVSTFEGIEQKINYLISSKQVERIPHLAEFIENSAHDLSLLLDNLLNWALKERGDLLLHPDSISVQSILRDVLKRLDKPISQKEIVLISRIPEELNMYVDGLTLHSLLRNIIHNAIKFSYRKGIVKIYHTEKDDFVTLHIEDQGIGMTEEQMDNVFTDINAASSTRGTENESGTGMGLMLCREMLEMQSGAMSINSKIGEGTTFSIVLPKRTATKELEVIGV